MVRCCSSRTDKAVVRIASFNELTEEIPNYRVSPYSRENERKRGGGEGVERMRIIALNLLLPFIIRCGREKKVG